MLEIKTNEVSHLPVKIDDKEYKMKTYSAMPFKDYVKLQSFGESYSNLIKKDISKLTDKEIDTLSAGMEGMVNLVMEDCPTSVLDAHSVTNKLALIQHFTESVPKEEEVSTEKSGISSQNLQGSMEGM